MKTCVIAVLFMIGLGDVSGQVTKVKPAPKEKPILPPPSADKDIIDVISKRLHMKMPEKPRTKKKVNFSFIPVSSGSASGNRVLVSSINVAFVAGDRESTKVSSIYFLPYTNFYNHLGFGAKQNLWTPNNNWNIPSEIRFSSLEQDTYGLGSKSTTHERVQLNYKNIRMYGTANRKLNSSFFAGPGFQYDRYYKMRESGYAETPNAFDTYGVGTGRASFASGLTFNVLHDSRKNSINPTNGFYYAATYRFNPTFLGNTYHWTSLYLDARKYFVIPSEKRKILALWGIYWGAYGNVPYLNLPGTQLELAGRSGRGYAQGRFRGKELIYFESEYRFDISNDKLFGGVVFVNAQSYKEPVTNRFQYINPAAGVGARIKFNKQSDTNLTLDFAAGKNSFNFYIGLGEFF